MLLSMFKAYRVARSQAISALRPECIVSGEGEWYTFDKSPLGVPRLRLGQSNRELTVTGGSPKRMLDSEIPEIPPWLRPWVSKQTVEQDGPFLVGHRYRLIDAIGRERGRPAFMRKLIAVCVKMEPGNWVTFEVVEDQSTSIDRIENSAPPDYLGRRLEIGYGDSSSFEGVTYLGRSDDREYASR